MCAAPNTSPLHMLECLPCVLQGTEGPWAAAFASAMGGSPTMYSASEPAEGSWWANGDGRKWVGGRTPTTSINFVTAHDGFALADLVTYNEKHNEANGEDNRWAELRLHVQKHGRFSESADQGACKLPRPRGYLQKSMVCSQQLVNASKGTLGSPLLRCMDRSHVM